MKPCALQLLSVLLGCLPWAVVAQEAVGTLKSLRGDTQVERAGVRRAARMGEPLHEQDRLITGTDGHAGIGFRDQSALAVGPRSDIDLSKYRFNPSTHQGEQEVRVRAGTLAAISGKVAKASPQAVQFNTGTVTLGVRGTRFVMEVQAAASGADASLWTDAQQQVVRSGVGLCWQTSAASAVVRSDCNPSRYVLLPDRDGSVGRIALQTREPASPANAHGGGATPPATLWVTQAYAGVEWGSRELRPVTLTAQEVQVRYQAVLDTLPPAPQTFTVRFVPGRSDQLTPESRAVLQQAREALGRWAMAVDVDVVGHTDTRGSNELNDALSLERARAVARWLDAASLPIERVHVSGRGKRELLIATPDETDEPANRRVDVTLY